VDDSVVRKDVRDKAVCAVRVREILGGHSLQKSAKSAQKAQKVLFPTICVPHPFAKNAKDGAPDLLVVLSDHRRFPSCQNCSINGTHWRTLAGPQECCGQRNPSLRLSLYRLRAPQGITPASADAFLVVGGRCTGRRRWCKARQSRRGKTALTFGAYFHIRTVFGRRREGKRISLVTMAGAVS
jgi:hypothetical protein